MGLADSQIFHKPWGWGDGLAARKRGTDTPSPGRPLKVKVWHFLYPPLYLQNFNDPERDGGLWVPGG